MSRPVTSSATPARARAHRALLALGLACAGCSGSPARAVSQVEAPVLVSPIVTLAGGPAPARAGFIGVVAAHERVALSLPVAVHLGAVHVHLGQEVAQNQLLAELDSSELDADLAAAEAALREARAETRQATASLQQARTESRQLERLLRDGMVSRREAAAASYELERARAQVQRARALDDQRQAALDKLHELRARRELRAPMAGRVVARGFDTGALVPPTAAIVTIGSAELDVRFAVPPERAGELRVGGEVVVHVGDRALAARVSALAPGVDTAMQLVVAVATLPASPEAPALGTRVSVTPAAPK